MPDEFEYVVRRPPAPLDRFVEQVWFARGSIRVRAERVAPTGSAVLGVVVGDPIVQRTRHGGHVARSGFLLGPDDRPLLNRPLGRTWVVGAVATPAGCAAAFGVEPAPLRGWVVDARAWSGLPAARRALRAATDPDEAVDVLVRALLEGVPTGAARPRSWPRVDDAVALLTADPRRDVAGVAREVGLSHAHLDRAFRRVVGLSPGTYARVVRLRALLAALGPAADWSRLAADGGWYDQSHLVRHFRRHTGTTPRAYLAAYRDVYGDAVATPGFAPVVEDVKRVQDRGRPPA